MKELFETSDLYISAYLLCVGERIQTQSRSPAGRAKFLFEGDKKRIEKIVMDYHNGAKVEATRLLDFYRKIKVMAHPKEN